MKTWCRRVRYWRNFCPHVCCYLRSFLVYNFTLKHIWIYNCVSFWQKSCLWVCCWCFTPLNTWAPGALIKKALSGSRMATNTLVLPKFPSLWQESILQLSSRNYFCIKDYLNVNHWLLGSHPLPILLFFWTLFKKSFTPHPSFWTFRLQIFGRNF